WPIYLWLDEQRTGLSGLPLLALRAGVTLAVAAASYVLVERPVRAGWRPARPAAPALAAGTVAAVALVAVAVPVLSRPPADPFGGAAGAAGPGAAGGETTDPDLRPIAPSEIPEGSLLAVYLGDSTMLNVAIGLSRWGLAHEGGVVPVQGLGGLGCAIARGGERRYVGEVGTSPPYCDEWPARVPEAVAAVRDTYGRADVAILATGPWDVADRRLPGDDTWRSPGDPVFDAHLRREIAAATDAFLREGLPVVWLTTPELDVGRHLRPRPPAPFPESDPARVAILNGMIREIAAAREGVAVVDLGAHIDALPEAEDVRLRPDGVHLERDAAEEVAAGWLGPAIAAATPPAPGG